MSVPNAKKKVAMASVIVIGGVLLIGDQSLVWLWLSKLATFPWAEWKWFDNFVLRRWIGWKQKLLHLGRFGLGSSWAKWKWFDNFVLRLCIRWKQKLLHLGRFGLGTSWLIHSCSIEIWLSSKPSIPSLSTGRGGWLLSVQSVLRSQFLGPLCLWQCFQLACRIIPGPQKHVFQIFLVFSPKHDV